MAFDWAEYLDLARFLEKGTPVAFTREAAFRTAVSRAYYSAFCHARNFARDRQGFKPTYQAKDHQRVRDHFRSRNKLRVSRTLDWLRQWRNHCDYDDQVPNLSKQVTPAIQRAKVILAQLP